MSKGINVFLGKEHVSISVDIDFNIQKNPAHLSAILERLLLEQLQEYPTAKLPEGKYKLYMTMCASSANNVVDEDPADEEEVNEVSQSENQ